MAWSLISRSGTLAPSKESSRSGIYETAGPRWSRLFRSDLVTRSGRAAVRKFSDPRAGAGYATPESEHGEFTWFGFAHASIRIRVCQVRIRATLGSDSEPSLKSRTYHLVRNPNSPCTVHTIQVLVFSTVPRAQEDAALGLCHDGLDTLKLTPARSDTPRRS